MSDPLLAIARCVCGKDPVLEPIAVLAERRWRVRCQDCQLMSLNFLSDRMAVLVWNDHRRNEPAKLGDE